MSKLVSLKKCLLIHIHTHIYIILMLGVVWSSLLSAVWPFLRCGMLILCVEWPFLLRYDHPWYGMVFLGVVWSSLVQYDNPRCGMTILGMVFLSVIWSYLVWYDNPWCGMVFLGVVRSSVMRHRHPQCGMVILGAALGAPSMAFWWKMLFAWLPCWWFFSPRMLMSWIQGGNIFKRHPLIIPSEEMTDSPDIAPPPGHSYWSTTGKDSGWAEWWEFYCHHGRSQDGRVVILGVESRVYREPITIRSGTFSYQKCSGSTLTQRLRSGSPDLGGHTPGSWGHIMTSLRKAGWRGLLRPLCVITLESEDSVHHKWVEDR